MGYRRSGLRAVVLVSLTGIAMLCAAAPAARADKQITAVFQNRFGASSYTMDQGEPLTFVNQDLTSHDVTADQSGADGQPLFASDTIGMGSSFVAGSQYLTTGSYPFHCSVHSFMTGALNVTSAGTPVPRPADTTPPTLKLRILDSKIGKLLTAGKLRVSTKVDEKSRVTLKATAKSKAGRTVTLATGSSSFAVAGSRTVKLRLTTAGRRLLRNSSSLRVKVTGRAKDAAPTPNTAVATARRTLTR